MTRYAKITPEGEIAEIVDFADRDQTLELAEAKGRWAPYITAQHDPVTQALDPPTLSQDGTTVLHLPRAKTADEIADMRQAKVAEVKAEAGRRILALYPDWKQRNMTALGVELSTIRHSRAWTAGEQAGADTLAAAWAAVKAVRTRSDEIEARIPDDPEGIASFDALQGWD